MKKKKYIPLKDRDRRREVILKAMLSFYSLENIDGELHKGDVYSLSSNGISLIDYVNSYCHQIRYFFNTGKRYKKDTNNKLYPYDGTLPLGGKEIDQRVLVDYYKQFYKDNKNSDSALEKLTKDVITLLSFEEFFIYLDSLGLSLEEENWYEKYLDEFFERYPEYTKIIQKFVIAAIYDSDLRFTVSNRKNKLKITWYIDQEFIFSNSHYERKEAVEVLFDDGLLMADLGEFHNKSAPKVIDQSLIWDGKLDFTSWNEEEVPKVCDAWRNGIFGKVTIKRGIKYISLDWDYPKSFRPYDLQEIRQNCRYRFNDVIEYEYYSHEQDDYIFCMIINGHGL